MLVFVFRSSVGGILITSSDVTNIAGCKNSGLCGGVYCFSLEPPHPLAKTLNYSGE